MDRTFEKAIEKVLIHEGGYVNDPDDPGGETNFGISKRSYPDLDIKNLTREKAEQIYFSDWWRKYGYELIDDPEISAKVFDLAVNMGPGTAHLLLQKSVMAVNLETIALDGKIGNETLHAVNGCAKPDLLLAELKLQAIQHYADMGVAKYLRGWVYRALD